MLRLNKLYLNMRHPESFDEVLQPLDNERADLIAAKNDIRDHLRKKIREASMLVLEMEHPVEPRFRTQGSWAYKTCIRPAHLPPQQMDWDFGVYLPVSVWSDQGPPRAMARKYFDLVETALSDLCVTKGWKLNRSKATCCRVQISSWAHIDIPLYAAPEEEFHRIAEKALSDAQIKSRFRESVALGESADLGELSDAKWDFLDSVHLAMRDGAWKRTDPEAVSMWFTDRLERHGEQLRRVCRYLKAWRDHHWLSGGGPSSVAIMIAVAQDFESEYHRDDIALERSANVLARALAGAIRERGIDNGDEDFNRLKGAERQEAVDKATVLASQLSAARRLTMSMARDAIGKVTSQFGFRIPSDISLVDPDDGASVVRNTPAAIVPPPAVGATHSG